MEGLAHFKLHNVSRGRSGSLKMIFLCLISWPLNGQDLLNMKPRAQEIKEMDDI